MKFDARLTGEAAAVAQPHASTLERLPATVPRVDPERAREVAGAVRRRARLPACAAGAPHRPGAGRARPVVRGRGAHRGRGGLRPHRDPRAGRLPGRGAGRPAQAAPARQLAAGGRRRLPGDPAGPRCAAASRRRAAAARSSRSTPAPSPCRPRTCGAASAAAASACHWRWTACAGRTLSCAACSAAVTRRRRRRHAVCRRGRRRRRDAARRWMSNRARRCTPCSEPATSAASGAGRARRRPA